MQIGKCESEEEKAKCGKLVVIVISLCEPRFQTLCSMLYALRYEE
ncbi:MAG: hypothetical protein NTX36_01595 [Proteobacteria bacterium]|nr:hypothetical protein [Pseudomonadota bacterium]